jgi:hypothetical protein
MVDSSASTGSTPELPRPTGPLVWAEPALRQAVEAFQEEVFRQLDPGPDGRSADDRRVVEEIVRLGMQPDILDALRGRSDPHEAIRDLATRYAFEALMVKDRAFPELDPLSQALIRRVLDVIDKRACQVAKRTGEDPREEDPDLEFSICGSLSRYVPRKPMGAHITWKLRHYEGAVSRAMRQIENLVKRPEVTGPFVAYVLDAPALDALKAQLLQLARGGGRRGLDYEAVVRFFALPETVAFVKRFAATVQTARTLYAEDEYAGIAWQGRRRLPADRRQGYLEVAIAELTRPQNVSLDGSEDDTDDGSDWHDVIPDAAAVNRAWGRIDLLHKEPFERWITRHAIEAQPHDPVWRVAELRFIRGLTPDEIVAQGLADRETLAAVQRQMDAFRADPDVWHVWVSTTMG